MKKTLLIATFICAISISTIAQSTTTSTGSKFSIGPNAGYGWTTIGNVDKSKFKAAGNFGLSMVYSAAEHFGIGVDAKYSIEGAKADVGGGMTNEIDLHYVRIPVKAIIFFKSYGDRGRPKLFVGPSFGFLSSANVNAPGGDVDIKNRMDNFDLGIHVGGGFNYRLVSRTWLNVDLAYTQGTKDIIHKDESLFRTALNANTPNDKFLNRNITLNVGVNFGL